MFYFHPFLGKIPILVINKALVEVTMPEEWHRREGG